MKKLSLLIMAAFVLVFSAHGQTATQNQLSANDEFRWGVGALHDGKINEAIASLVRSLSFDSSRTLTRYWLGRAYYFGGFEDAALQEWNWIRDRGTRTAVLDSWIERVNLDRGLTPERLGSDIVPGRYVTMSDIPGLQGELVLFQRPTMVRPRSDGYFYVVSYGTHSLLVMDPNGVRRQEIDGGLEGFGRPFDLLIRPDGSLLVTEFGADRIAVVSANGTKQRTFGSRAADEGGLLGPQFIAGDEQFIYVTDHGNRRVARYTADGEFLFTFGRTAPGFTGLREPSGIAVDNGAVYVADRGRASIVVFDESGNYIREITSPAIESPEGISTYSPGRLLVSDGNRLYVVETATDRLFDLAEASSSRRFMGAVRDANGNLLAADFASDSVLVLAASEELYTGLNVEVDFVNSDSHPTVFVAVTVSDRTGRPLLGLSEDNFRVTEDRFPTGPTELTYAGFRSGETSIAIVADRARNMVDDREAVRDGTAMVVDALDPDSRLWTVSAGEQPLVESEPGTGRLAVSSAAAGSIGQYGTGRLDTGIRLAGSRLATELGSRSIIVFSDGTLDTRAFDRYGITETAQFLVNNHVELSVIYTVRNGRSEELDYLAEVTGGESIFLYRPEGVVPLVERIQAEPSGRYVLSYQSVFDSDFGRRYIPLEVEAYVLERSGRDEAGYFGPLEF
jgi:DNA-binding beta-propeller fold protein YncE